MIMKNIGKWFIALSAMVACIGFTACNDTDDGFVEATFSKMEGLDMALLDDADFTSGSFIVESNGSWRVRADKAWITFSTTADGEFYNDITGNKGITKVFVRVTNEGREFVETNGKIVLLAGGVEQLVASVVRPAKDYEFAVLEKVVTFETVTNSDGLENIVSKEEINAVDKVNFKHDNTVWVGFETNFECAIIDYPEWMMEPIRMDEGYSLDILEELLLEPLAGTLKVGNSDFTVVYEVPVVYDGMDFKKLNIEMEYSPWMWNASLDGKSFEQESSSMDGDAEKIVMTDKFDISVVCRNYACRFFFVEVDMEGNCSLKEGNDAWIKAERKENSQNEYAITVEPFTVSSSKMQRSGYLFVLPDALCEEFLNNLSAGEAVVDLYEANVAVEITQADANGTKGCIIMDGDGNIVNSTPETEGDMFTYFDSDYSIENDDISACEFVPGKTYDINTKMTKPGGAKGVEINNVVITYGNDPETGLSVIEKIVRNDIGLAASDKEETTYNEKVENADEWNLKISLQEDGFYHVTFKVPESQTNMLALRMYKWNYGPTNLKVLIMRIKK